MRFRLWLLSKDGVTVDRNRYAVALIAGQALSFQVLNSGHGEKRQVAYLALQSGCSGVLLCVCALNACVSRGCFRLQWTLTLANVSSLFVQARRF